MTTRDHESVVTPSTLTCTACTPQARRSQTARWRICDRNHHTLDALQELHKAIREAANRTQDVVAIGEGPTTAAG